MEESLQSLSTNLEQEMAARAAELTTQRRARQEALVDMTLHTISEAVESQESQIASLMSTGKSPSQQALREIVTREVCRAADGRLWCREYDEKAKSNQLVLTYTGSHWQRIEPQQWKDFVRHCAERCGLPESLMMNQTFMKPLIEGVAYNVAEFRRQRTPADEVWMNLRNGTLVVKADGSVHLRDHSKDDLFTYTLDYDYDRQASYERWQKFLDRVLPEADLQQVLCEAFGYCFMKDHSLEKMFWLYGQGQNGKSVTLEVIEALLGSTNVSYLSLSDLTNDEVKRAGIEGKLLNISHESGKDVNASVLKQLTSGERVLIKHLYVDPRETNDYGKFFAAFNALPKAEITFGYFRRLIIIPYNVTIPPEEVDRQLTDKLKQELSGILNWVLNALPRLMNSGRFTQSESCEKALEQYRLQSDNVKLFVSERCEECEYTTAASEVYMAYKEYCDDSGLRPLGKQKFYERLAQLMGQPEVYGGLKRFKLKLVAQ